jgi:hypothetical protein
MYNPLWWPARPLTPRVKGREGLGSFKIVRWRNGKRKTLDVLSRRTKEER